MEAGNDDYWSQKKIVQQKQLCSVGPKDEGV